MDSQVSFRGCSRRPAKTTEAPDRANPRAKAAPIPLPPPVIIAVRPSKENSSVRNGGAAADSENDLVVVVEDKA